MLPASAKVLNPEVLGRTSPDLRDLVVALAAGAYATMRDDVSDAAVSVKLAGTQAPPSASLRPRSAEPSAERSLSRSVGPCPIRARRVSTRRWMEPGREVCASGPKTRGWHPSSAETMTDQSVALYHQE